jgi:hypothetical protein
MSDLAYTFVDSDKYEGSGTKPLGTPQRSSSTSFRGGLLELSTKLNDPEVAIRSALNRSAELSSQTPEEQFSEYVTQNLSDPEEALRTALNPDEVVVARFKVFYPERYIPLHEDVFWTIVTCGLYLFVILRRHMEKKRMCFGCCFPAGMK